MMLCLCYTSVVIVFMNYIFENILHGFDLKMISSTITGILFDALCLAIFLLKQGETYG